MIHGGATSWGDTEFRKSSFSGGASGSCVELAWRKSTFSGGANGSCVEVARTDALFGVRDSKHAPGPVLTFGEAQGKAFVAAVKRLGQTTKSSAPAQSWWAGALFCDHPIRSCLIGSLDETRQGAVAAEPGCRG